MTAPGIVKLLKPMDEQTDINKRADGYLKYFQGGKNLKELEDRRKVSLFFV